MRKFLLVLLLAVTAANAQIGLRQRQPRGRLLTKFTITSANAAFIAAAATADVTLFTLPARGKVLGVSVKHSAVFSDGAGAMSEVSVSVGDSSSATFYTSATNIGEATAVADTTFQDTSLRKSSTFAARAVVARFTATGRNFGDAAATFLTGGSVDIWIEWTTLP